MNIEKNIPIERYPKHPGKKKGSPIVDVLHRMEVGDSVLVLAGKQLSFRAVAQGLKFKIATRKVSPTEHRVWLIAK